MTENLGLNPPNRRRETEMSTVEAIQDEMARAVRFLGGDGPAKEQNSRAAQRTRLSHTVIERLRWRKIKRVPADIADAIRDAVERHNEESLSRAKHQLFIAQQQAAAVAARLGEIDRDFYGAEIDQLRRLGDGPRPTADRMGGE